MGYLHAFQGHLDKRDPHKLLQLWEEYCKCDSVDVEEFKQILLKIKKSDFTKLFGQYIELALPLWKMVQEPEKQYALLRDLIDLQTTNSALLADLATQALKERYGNDPHFSDFIRMVGLRARDHFQGAIANYDLLAHMKPGKCVFHAGGWGAGEIVDVSLVREQLFVEFENVGGKKDISFANAFKILIPLPDEHFLARRFIHPDELEKLAKENPVLVIRMLLQDIGPRTAGELKDELCELVIPEADWAKWWPAARAKIKKDTMIKSPDNLREPFHLRQEELSHEDRFHQSMHGKTGKKQMILTTYNYIRDFSETLRKEEAKSALKDKLTNLLNEPDNSPVENLQILFLLESITPGKLPNASLPELITKLDNIEQALDEIEIIAFKKRVLMAFKEHRKDWIPIFLSALHSPLQTPIREYLFKELMDDAKASKQLEQELQLLIGKPEKAPEFFFWYFQKAISSESIPFSDKEGQCQLLESFLILLNILETKPQYRDLARKMYVLFSAKRYEMIRTIIEGSSLAFIKEFLLLVAKCQSLTGHDIKIMRSLAEVVHPSLATTKKVSSRVDPHVVWTTNEGYVKTKDRLHHLGTVEMVENAREIEAARALGDLRENSEFKFALEKRSRLQAELKTVSDLLNHARVITKDDIPSEEVGVGVVVDLTNDKGEKVTYTILGPWDADPEKNILSFQSKLAQQMVGHKIGDKIQFKEEDFTISSIKSYLE
jgi:transcription elongation factor GreA